MTDFALRAALRRTLLDNGVPPAHVDEVVDLSLHAADRAAATLLDVISRAGDARVATCALGVASSVLRGKLDTLDTAQQQFAREQGVPVRRAHVTVAA